MDLRWINNAELFPNINISLMNEVVELARETKLVSLKFEKKYNLQYVGELAERWHERNIVQNREDLLGLILGVSLCSSGTFLYDQKKLFIKSVCEYLKDKWDSTAAAAILSFGHREVNDIPELASLRDMLILSEDSLTDQAERILMIALLSDTFDPRNSIDGLRSYILNLIDGLQLSWLNVHKEYPLFLMLSEVYTNLQKPKAKEFKTKGISRVLQVIAALRTKEITQEQNYHQILGTKREVIPVLNFYLAYQNTPRNHTITGPGFERIKENFINCHFTSENDVPDEVVTLVDEMITEFGKSNNDAESHPLQFLLSRLSCNGKSPFPNKNNLKLFVGMAKTILIPNINESYIYLLHEDVIEEEQRSVIIKALLESRRNLSKEQFEYLEEQRLQLGLNINSFNYTDMCLKYGHASLENVEDLEQRGMVAHAIEILKRSNSFVELVSLMERVEAIPYHKFLTEDKAFDRLKGGMDKATKKRLYPLYLNALYIFRASKYAEVIFDMVRSNEFVELFGTTTAEVDDIERKLYISNLLPENTAKAIREKYMTAEELEAVRTLELCEELKKCSCYGIGDFARKHLSKMIDRENLREAFIQRMITLVPRDKYDIGRLLTLFYQLRVKGVFSSLEVARIETAMLQRSEKFKID